MRRMTIALVAPALLLAATPETLSDPVGVYAIIERVVVQPETGPAQTIQLWGVFALANQAARNEYHAPGRGYTYYRVNESRADDARVARIEWADLKSVAGTGRAIGYGARFLDSGRVRPARETPAGPDIYPLGFGLVPLPSRVQPTHLGLTRVPHVLRPADGSTVAMGPIQLVARNIEDPDVRYIFEIESDAGISETSERITPGDGETSWTPAMTLRAGEEYTWRVHVVSSTFIGAPVEAVFTATGNSGGSLRQE